MESSWSYLYVLVFVVLALFFVEVRFPTGAAGTNQISNFQEQENVACKIKIINTITGNTGSTQWMSKKDALVILRKAKKLRSQTFFFKMECEEGRFAPPITVMLG